MADRLVAVGYPVNDNMARLTLEVLGGQADVRFLHGLDDGARRDALEDAEALLSWRLLRETPAAELARAERLRLIQLLSAGADGMDFSVLPEGLLLASNVGAFAEPIAEHVMAMALALARRLAQHHAELARGTFDQRTPLLTLEGAVCAILGFGGIGKATARLMRAFGARIHAVNSTGRTTEPVEFAGTLADIDRVLAAADIVVVCLPLTRATRGLIGRRELGLMKPAAIVINVGRAAVVDEAALYEHLRDLPESGAGLDVWWHEPHGGAPFRTDHPFLDLPNVIGSPHNSSQVAGIMEEAARRAAENVARYLRGEAVAGVIERGDYAGLSG